MTFFYDMNKKLKEVLDTPKSEHKQLNERDEGKHNNATTGFKALAAKAAKEYGSKAAGERVAGAVHAKMKKAGKLEETDMEESAFQAAIGKKKYGADGMKALQKAGRDHASAKTMSNIRNKYDKYDESMDEGMLDSLKQGMKKVAKKGLETLGHGSDEAMRKDLQKKMGVPQTGKKPVGEEYGPMEGEGDRIAQKKLARQKTIKALTQYDNADDMYDNVQRIAKQTGFLDQYEMMLYDDDAEELVVAALKAKGMAEGGAPMTAKQKSFAKLAPPKDKITFADKIAGAKKEVDEMLGDVAADAMRKAVKGKKMADEGSDWSQLGKEYSRPKIGSVERGAKHDIEHTATGRKVTRRTDDQGISVGADDDTEGQPVKRGRGRPKGTGKAMGAKGPSGKSKLMKRESEQELDEKAVSKKQQKFMGMVHAAQKGEKAASPEVAKVAKTMKKKDAEDFASTKHKGLPEKVKSKKKEKTEESDAAPTSGKGVQFGKGIYDSLNREIENLIAESMSINASDSTEGGKSLTITATDEDAIKLAGIVRNAGLGGGGEMDSHEHGEEPCEVCGSEDCGCGDIEEAVSENEPNWPTDEVESDDALQYSGGLNKPKTDVAGDGQTTVPNTAVHTQDEDELRRMMEMAGLQSELKPWERTMKEEAEEELDEQEQVMAVEESTEELDEAKEMCEVCEATPCKCDESIEESLARFRSLAGLKEAKKVEEDDMEEGNKFTGNLAKARAAGKEEADLDGDGDLEKVRESVNRMTNLWKAYKG